MVSVADSPWVKENEWADYALTQREDCLGDLSGDGEQLNRLQEGRYQGVSNREQGKQWWKY